MSQTTLKLDGLKVDKLKAMAKILGLKGYSKMDKPTLLKEIGNNDSTAIAAAYASVMEAEEPKGTAAPADAPTYPYPSSADVPKGAYCSCGEPIPVNDDSTLAVANCAKCNFDFTSGDVDFSTMHGNHVIVHKIGEKPEICPMDGERLDGTDAAPAPTPTTEGNDVASATTTSRDGSWAKAAITDNVLTYENSAGVAFSLELAELDKLKKRFGEDYARRALVKTVELPCIAGCDSTWSPRASFIEKVILAIKTDDDIPTIQPVDPRHNECWVSFCRSNANMLESARTEKFEAPTAEELSELRKHPWAIEDGRVYHNNGDPSMAFSFDIKDAETNSSAVAHLHKCHGPRCKFMIRTYADWALEQARKAEGGEDFAFLSSFGQRHDDCKEQAKEIRAAERAELEAQEPASEPVPVAKVETPAVTPAPAAVAPEPVPAAQVETPAVTPAPAAVTPEPVPTKVETSAPAVAPVMPATAPDPVVPMASAPVAASSEVAQVIMAVGSLLSGMKQTDVARILEALPKQKDVNVAEIMQAAAAISDKQTSKLGEVASASQAQLGRVIEKLLEDRTATVRAVDDIPRRVRAEIYGDVVDPRGMDEVYQQVRGSRPLSVERPSGE